MLLALWPRRLNMQQQQHKEQWWQLQEQLRHDCIVTVSEGMGVSPCLYFGTRRCTYSDVMSVVTTVRPLPPFIPEPLVFVSTEDGSQPSSISSKLTVAWANARAFPTKQSFDRDPSLPFDHGMVDSPAYVHAPFEAGVPEDRRRRFHERQSLALQQEKQFFMQRLQHKRQTQYDRELQAVLVLQRMYRGYLLRQRFMAIKEKLRVRKRIRSSLVQVTKGTAIILGERERRNRVLAAQNAAAARIQGRLRIWMARKVLAKERSMHHQERRQRSAILMQCAWRSSLARACTRKIRSRRRDEQATRLAQTMVRLFRGYTARQRVRRMWIRRQRIAVRRIQSWMQIQLAKRVVWMEQRHQRERALNTAAVEIQKIVRGRTARAFVQSLRIQEQRTIQMACALMLQRVYRGFISRQRVRFLRVMRLRGRALACAVHTTRIVRGFLARRFVQLERMVQETDLLVQTRRGNLTAVIDLLDGYGTIDELPADLTQLTQRSRHNVLHLAARLGHLDIITHVVPKLLTLAPSTINAVNANGDTPLELAILHGHEQIAAYLLTKLSDLAKSSNTYLPKATRRSDAGRLRSLVLEAARQNMGAIVVKLLLLFPETFSGREVDSWTQSSVLHESLLLPPSHQAIATPNELMAATIEMLVTKLPQIDINAQDFVGFTALHLASAMGNLPVVQKLLQLGADITVADPHGRTAWRIALLQGHEACFLEIRRKWLNAVSPSDPVAADLVQQDEGFSRVLVQAATKSRTDSQLHPQLSKALLESCGDGNLGHMRFLIEECSISVNTIDQENDNESLLMMACRLNQTAIVKFLLKQDSLDAHYKSAAGSSALTLALHSAELTTLLVNQAGADPCQPFDETRGTILHEATRRGYDLRPWLHQYSPDWIPQLKTALVDADNRTPLHVAAVVSNVSSAKMLANSGQPIDHVEDRGHRTALHKACRAGNLPIARKLVQLQPDAIWALDVNGRSSFFDAVQSGQVDCLELLLKHGASTHGAFPIAGHCDKNGVSLLDEAVASGTVDGSDAMVSFLLGRFPTAAMSQETREKLGDSKPTL